MPFFLLRLRWLEEQWESSHWSQCLHNSVARSRQGPWITRWSRIFLHVWEGQRRNAPGEPQLLCGWGWGWNFTQGRVKGETKSLMQRMVPPRMAGCNHLELAGCMCHPHPAGACFEVKLVSDPNIYLFSVFLLSLCREPGFLGQFPVLSWFHLTHGTSCVWWSCWSTPGKRKRC